MSAIVLGFLAGKGGVGKSALTQLFANWLAYIEGKSVLVIDGDPQGTTTKQRAEDYDTFGEEATANAYPIELVDPPDVANHIKLNSELYEYILVDLGGSMAIPGNVSAYSAVDHIFFPTSTSKDDLKEIPDFMQLIESRLVPVREKLGKEPAKFAVVLSRVAVNLKDFKEIDRIRNLPADLIDRDIQALKNGNTDQIEYYYPYKILKATIPEAKGVFGQYQNTVVTDESISIADRYASECEYIHQFLMQ